MIQPKWLGFKWNISKNNIKIKNTKYIKIAEVRARFIEPQLRDPGGSIFENAPYRLLPKTEGHLPQYINLLVISIEPHPEGEYGATYPS